MTAKQYAIYGCIVAVLWVCGDRALAEKDPAMDLYYRANSLCSASHARRRG